MNQLENALYSKDRNCQFWTLGKVRISYLFLGQSWWGWGLPSDATPRIVVKGQTLTFTRSFKIATMQVFFFSGGCLPMLGSALTWGSRKWRKCNFSMWLLMFPFFTFLATTQPHTFTIFIFFYFQSSLYQSQWLNLNLHVQVWAEVPKVQKLLQQPNAFLLHRYVSLACSRRQS